MQLTKFQTRRLKKTINEAFKDSEDQNDLEFERQKSVVCRLVGISVIFVTIGVTM